MHLSARKVVTIFFVFFAFVFFSTRPAHAQTLPDAIGDTIVYSSNNHLDAINLSGADLIDFNPGNASAYQPDVSKDARHIYFVSDRDGNPEIYVIDAYGSNPVRLTNNSDNDFWPAVSPDGQKVAFESLRDGNWEIYVMNSDGSNVQRLTNNEFVDHDPSWSPDGQYIIFYGQRSAGSGIFRINADGSNEVQLTSAIHSQGNPRYSPDGQYIAFWSEPSGVSQPDIFRMNADGSNQVNLTNNTTIWDSNPSWSPDGTTIAFQRGSSSVSTYFMNPDGTNLRQIGMGGQTQQTPKWGLVGNQPPVLDEAPRYSFLLIGQEETLSVNATDPEGGPVSYYWDLNSDGVYEASGSSIQYSAVGKSPGNYDGRVKAVDNVGLRSRQDRTVHVDDGITIDDFALLGLEGMWLKKEVTIGHGDVGIQFPSAGPFLNHNAQLTIGRKVEIPYAGVEEQPWIGQQIYANSMWVGPNSVLPELHFSQLTASSSTQIWRQTPTYNSPLVSNLPIFPTFSVGTQDVLVATDSAQTLSPGSYRNLDVMPNGVLRLNGGTYNFKSWDVRENAKVFFLAPTEIRINGRLKTGELAEVRNDPDISVTFPFSKLFVKGKNGDTGSIDDSPKAVSLGAQSVFNGHIDAPNGSVIFHEHGGGNGTFIGKWIVVNQFAQIAHEDIIGP